MLEAMTASDMLPFMRYAHACVAMLLISVSTVPFAIIHTPLTCIVAPLVLIAFLVFCITFVALGYSYMPTDELLDLEGDMELIKKVENDDIVDNSQQGATNNMRNTSGKQNILT